MVKRKFPGFPIDFEIDDSLPTEDPSPVITFKYISGPFGVTHSGRLLITIDGIIQILISGKEVMIIDAGARLKSYEMAMANEVVFSGRKMHPVKKRKVVNAPMLPELNKLATKKSLEVIAAEVKPYLKNRKIVLCLVSHAHPDHVSLLKLILADREVTAFVLGGAPYNYTLNPVLKSFLEFLHTHCKKFKNLKVYLTIKNEDISPVIRSDLYLRPFNNDYIKGVRIVAGDQYIASRVSISAADKPEPKEKESDEEEKKEEEEKEVWDPHSSPVEFAQYLKVADGSLELTLYSVNSNMKIWQGPTPKYECDSKDEDKGCMVVHAHVHGTSVIFTGDSNIRNQQRAIDQLADMNKPVDILVLSRNGEYSTSGKEYGLDLTAPTTKSCLESWDPQIFAIPCSSNQLLPKFELIADVFSVIENSEKNQQTLDAHEIIFFVKESDVVVQENNFNQNAPVTYNYVSTDGESSKEKDNASAEKQSAGDKNDGMQLRQRVSKIVSVSPSANLAVWCRNNNCEISFISHARDDIYRVFIRTTHPIIVLNSPVQMDCEVDECKIYQNVMQHKDED